MSSVAIPDVSAIIGGYDGCIIDLWGVVHDGETLYPGVAECLTMLAESGKRVQFLSNAPRVAAKVAEVLDQLGVGKHLYDRIVTSGQLVHDQLVAGSLPAFANKKILFIGPERDAHLLEGTGLETAPARTAEAVLCAGLDDDDLVVENYIPLLEQAASRKLPMLCANPDREVIKHNGFIWPCAGWLAEIYEQMGGKVTYIGKPYPDVYTHCLAFWPDIPKNRILCIGDNLATDIRGANHAGMDSLLIAGGVLKIACGMATSSAVPSLADITPHMRQHKAWPTAVTAFFR